MPERSVELNTQLRQIYALIPRIPIADSLLNINASVNRMFEREESPYTRKLVNRVTELVAPAPITPSFRSRIVSAFDIYLGTGITPEKETEIKYEDFSYLENDDPEDGGIFDPSKAKGLERTAFIRQVGGEVRFKLSAEKVQQDSETADEVFKSFARIAMGQAERNAEAIEKWKREFSELHGEELIQAS